MRYCKKRPFSALRNYAMAPCLLLMLYQNFVFRRNKKRPVWTEGRGGVRNLIFCGRHKWMAPYSSMPCEFSLWVMAGYKVLFILYNLCHRLLYGLAPIGLPGSGSQGEVVYM